MRDGEAFVGFSVPVSPQSAGIPYAMASAPVDVPIEAMLLWSEKTGRIKGLLFKSPEIKTIKVRGHRCVACGYLELYAADGKEALRILDASKEAVSL